MGYSRHRLGQRMGTFLYYRNRGRQYADLARGWVVPTSAVAGVAKYFGADVWLSVAVGVLVPVVIELSGLAIGWFDIAHGGARSEMAISNQQDPWKMRVEAILTKLEARLDAG